MNEPTSSASGASNASDFQPPTQNPQDTSTNLQPTPDNATGDRLDQLPASQLTVETVQSQTDSQVSQVSSQGFDIASLLPFLVLLAVSVLLFRRWNFFLPSKPIQVSTETSEPEREVAAATKKTEKSAKKPTNTRPRKKTKSRKKK